ncbi:MAG: hypothetical protein ABSC06_09020 [Rhodopila sp.]|jgi:hypothetical protein
MIVYPAVIVHGLADAEAALAPGLPVTLLSAPGAACFAGCNWWREIVNAARAAFPDTEATDILDCADASGTAMGALRSGVSRLVLLPEAPGWCGVAAIAARQGGFVLPQAPAALDLAQPNGFVLPQAPAALDLAQPNGRRQLHAWLRSR